MLETRLDNVLYRMGVAASRAEARQVVRHGHVIVNKRQVNIASFQVSVGDVITVSGSEKMMERYKGLLEQNKDQKRVEWLDFDSSLFKATVKKLPERSDVLMPIQEQLIVELYSK